MLKATHRRSRRSDPVLTSARGRMHCGETRAAGPRMAASRQITTLLGVWGGEEPAVIAGDMNLQPDEEDVELFLDAGLESVQEEIGVPGANRRPPSRTQRSRATASTGSS